jgi:PAS domain S-box-containing protein
MAVVRDVRESRRADEAMGLLAAIVDSSQDAIIAKSLDGVILYWNTGAELLYGYSPDEAVGKNVSILIPEGMLDETTGLLGRIARGEAVEHFETARVRKDGSRVEVSLTLSPVRDRHGTVMAASVIARDVTERHRIEASIAANEAKFRGLLESAPDAMVIVDTAGQIVLVNHGAEELFGFRPDDLIGQPIELLLPRSTRARHVRHRSAFLSDPRARPMGVGLELSAVRADGSELPVEVSLSPLDTAEGPLVSAAIRDISGRQEVGRRLARAADLERSNADLEAFAYMASHDLQEPLRKVTQFCQLLKQEYGGRHEMADTYMDFAIDGASRMQQLINDLLELSRVGLSDVAREWVDMRVVVTKALEILREPLEETGAAVEIGDMPRVFAAPSGLVQLYQNLVGNALKFRDPARVPVIRIGGERNSGEWRFWVTDNGIGLEPRHANRIFEAFRRLHDRSQYPGTGIGLAICRRIVERHGGRIWVESQPGASSTFYWTIPG